MRQKFFLFSSIFWALAILYFAIVPRPIGIQLLPNNDKILHLAAFGILAFLILLSGHFSKNGNSVIAASSYSLAIELIQFFLPYRTFEFLDFTSGVAGASAAFVIAQIAIMPAYSKILQKQSLEN